MHLFHRPTCRLFSIAAWLVFLALLVSFNAYAGKKERLGLITGIGSQGNILLHNALFYRYDVALIHLNYSVCIVERKQLALFLLTEPQFNFARFRDKDIPQFKPAFEFGTSFGFQLQQQLKNDKWKGYLGLQSGPHFISDSPLRQVPGFIIANHAYFGSLYHLSNHLSLDLRLGVRHMSNAGLEEPNGGINTFVFMVGLAYTHKPD